MKFQEKGNFEINIVKITETIPVYCRPHFTLAPYRKESDILLYYKVETCDDGYL